MSQQALITDVKTHVIITRSNLHIYVTKAQYEYILSNSNDDQTRGVPLRTEKGAEVFVSWGDIASIPDVQTYWDSYPDRRPDPMSTIKSVFPDAVEDKPLPRATKSIREHAEEYLAAHPNDDTPQTRFLKTVTKNTVGDIPGQKKKHAIKYKTWQEYYYANPLELLEKKTKDQTMAFLNESPPPQLELMHDIMTTHVKKHDPCDCPDVGICRPSGLLAAIVQQMSKAKNKKPAVDKKPDKPIAKS